MSIQIEEELNNRNNLNSNFDKLNILVELSFDNSINENLKIEFLFKP